jgi:hypothetical protein
MKGPRTRRSSLRTRAVSRHQCLLLPRHALRRRVFRLDAVAVSVRLTAIVSDAILAAGRDHYADGAGIVEDRSELPTCRATERPMRHVQVHVAADVGRRMPIRARHHPRRRRVRSVRAFLTGAPRVRLARAMRHTVRPIAARPAPLRPLRGLCQADRDALIVRVEDKVLGRRRPVEAMARWR